MKRESGVDRALRCFGVGVISHEAWKEIDAVLLRILKRAAVGAFVLLAAVLVLNSCAAAMGYGA